MDDVRRNTVFKHMGISRCPAAGQGILDAAALDGQMSELTAQGVALSEKLGKELDAYLAGAGMVFSQLNDDPDAIAELERRLYTPLSGTLDAALATAVRQAKKDGLVDNFIYGSVSPDYLATVMDTL